MNDRSSGSSGRSGGRSGLAVVSGLILAVLVACGPAAAPQGGAAPTSLSPTVTVVEVQATVPTTPTTAVASVSTTAPPTTGALTTTTAPAATTAVPTPASCPNGTYVNTAGNVVCRPASSSTGPPPGATAQCKDGEYSSSQSRSGTCSGHGGVARWL